MAAPGEPSSDPEAPGSDPALRSVLAPRRSDAAESPDLRVFAGSGVMPGVDLAEAGSCVS